MGRLVLRRLVATIPVLLLVSAGVFALIHLTPGDPIDAMMAESVDATRQGASPEGARARPAAPPPVPRLDGADPARRPGPVDPQPGAGDRERRPPDPARACSSRGWRWPSPSGRHAGRHPLGRAPQYRHRPLRHLVRAVRHLHAEFPHRAPADLRLRRDAPVAADLGVRRPVGGAVGRAALARPARDHAGAGPRRGRDADAPIEHARDAVRGLRPHRAGQGPGRRDDRAQPRAEERA